MSGYNFCPATREEGKEYWLMGQRGSFFCQPASLSPGSDGSAGGRQALGVTLVNLDFYPRAHGGF